ncbi:alpha/beta hydrolase [Rhodopirellula halodulae]|uniref:alpha/beta hydrolase n=1 Tax=Rhodopirellula halodulae TaxID=2894198 RepID=UPI001E359453|nr:alpha/beta hydrolase [Rhodopirellula sp. JC737]
MIVCGPVSAQRPDRSGGIRSERSNRGGPSGGERSGGRTRNETSPVLDQEFIETKLPKGTRYISDVVFKTVDETELKLDLLLPENPSGESLPVAVWIHGGAWMRGNKARDLHRFDQLTSRLLQRKMAFVSIEYRLSGQASYPEPVRDCVDALAFLNRNRDEYHLDTDRMFLMGTSAGGHLVSLIGSAFNDLPAEFVSDPQQSLGTLLGVVDFYGPADLVFLQGKRDEIDYENDASPEARFLGHSPLTRPDLARAASPTNYVSEDSPPFLIFHGDEDTRVPMTQSVLLNSLLKSHGVSSKLVVVEGARHGDQKFDDEVYNNDVLEFVDSLLKRR